MTICHEKTAAGVQLMVAALAARLSADRATKTQGIKRNGFARFEEERMRMIRRTGSRM